MREEIGFALAQALLHKLAFRGVDRQRSGCIRRTISGMRVLMSGGKKSTFSSPPITAKILEVSTVTEKKEERSSKSSP